MKKIRLETSKGTGIDNYQDTEIPSFNLNWNEEISKKFKNITPRTNPSLLYNCHGMVFASRRTRIEKTNELNKIIDDDNYEEIIDDVKPGDVIIYYSNEGDPNHSGIVIGIDKNLNLPIIFSKWGSAGEFIHLITDISDQYGPNRKFFRCRL